MTPCEHELDVEAIREKNPALVLEALQHVQVWCEGCGGWVSLAR